MRHSYAQVPVLLYRPPYLAQSIGFRFAKRVLLLLKSKACCETTQ